MGHYPRRRDEASWSDAAFDGGVSTGRRRGHEGLFEARARVVTRLTPKGGSEAFMSGLHSGAEPSGEATADILVGDPALTGLCRRTLGVPVPELNGDDAAAAGLVALREIRP